MPLASWRGGEWSEVIVCGQPVNFSVHLPSSAVTPAESVHKSRGDRAAYVGAVEEIMCVMCVIEGALW